MNTNKILLILVIFVSAVLTYVGTGYLQSENQLNQLKLQSNPEIFSQTIQSCEQSFTIKIACGQNTCLADSDCEGSGMKCASNGYCSKIASEDTCLDTTQTNKVTACCSTVACQNLTPEQSSLEVTAQLPTFTCTSSNSMAKYAKFRVINSTNEVLSSSSFIPLTTPTGNSNPPFATWKPNFTPVVGAPTVQCRVCTAETDATCTSWGRQTASATSSLSCQATIAFFQADQPICDDECTNEGEKCFDNSICTDGTCQIEACVDRDDCTCQLPTPPLKACGAKGCDTDADCMNDYKCIAADNGTKYCGMSMYESICKTASDSNAYNYCCEAQPMVCGQEGCNDDDDCKDNNVCTTANNGKKYCSDSNEDIKKQCKDNPNSTTCCKPLYACAQHGCIDNSDCRDNLVCVRREGDGAGTCAVNEDNLKKTCLDNPSYGNCCEQPPAVPELPRAGALSPIMLFTLGGAVLVALGLLF